MGLIVLMIWLDILKEQEMKKKNPDIFKEIDDNFKNNNNHASKNKNEIKLNLKEILQKELYDILYAEINEKYIREKLEKFYETFSFEYGKLFNISGAI